MPVDGWRVLTPPVVDGHYVEGETQKLAALEDPPPVLIFGPAEVSPTLTTARSARVWAYGDLFTVGFRKTERGTVHVRVQSSAVALWTSHAEWCSALRMLGDELAVQAWTTTRVDVAVDVEGLDVQPTLLPYIVGHRGSILFKAKGAGRQIEVGSRSGSKRFMRIYLKSAMDCSTYLPTWERQGYAGGRVVRIEVELKNGGLPSREPEWFSCAGHVRAVFGDAVRRVRVTTRVDRTRRSRSDTHPAWSAACDDAVKWVAPPDPSWTTRQRFEASRRKASRALGALVGKIDDPWREFEDLADTLRALQQLGAQALSDDDFAASRDATRQREEMLRALARARYRARKKDP